MCRSRQYTLTFLSILLMFFAGWSVCAAPSTDGWDEALDRYDAICKKCIELKNKSLLGEAISADTFKGLLTELADLRKTLQNGSGSMTEAQRTRFEQIRRTYFGTTEDSVVAKETPRADTVSITDTLQTIDTPTDSLDDKTPGFWSCFDGPGKIRRCHFGFAPFAGIPTRKGLSAKDLSAGLAIFALDWKTKVGAYLKGCSTFYYKTVSGICFSDGTLTDGSYIWTTGNTGYSEFSVTGGIIYRFHPVVGVWAGVGYSSRTVYWESTDGAWYRVKDASMRGVCPEAGLLFTVGNFRHGNLSILAGGRFPMAKQIAVDVGVGWLF